MERRKLGSTGMEITVVGLGTWAIGGWMWGAQEEADSIAAIEAGVEAGVNWLDSAPIYGSGLSEQMCGDALQRIPAARRPYVFTKFGLGDDSSMRNPSATYAQVKSECDASLKRLRVERIDLYQLHWPVSQPVAETARACDELLKEGKVRALGVSNFSVAELEGWVATGVPLHTLQTPYSVLRPASEKELLPWCQKHGLGTLAYSPLFRGMLFGTWTKEKRFDPTDSRSQHKDYAGPRFVRHIQAVDEIKAVAAQHGRSCADVALGMLLRNPALTGCIVGARNGEQGKLLGTLGQPIGPEIAAAVENVLARLGADLANI
jgi:aryl-alcohol dehydrogenase-like predicted oxidoreductase